MEILRKIACIHLRNQYERAKKYLENEINKGNSTENVCNRFRCASIAYAQVKYVVFLKDGTSAESVKCKLNADNTITKISLYTEFMSEVESDVKKALIRAVN